MPALFDPLAIRGTTLPNRLAVSPMCQYSCEDGDGLATPWHHVHLGSRAVGGAGLVIAEATAVEPRGRITPQDLGIWSATHAEALSQTASFVRDQGSVPGIQLAHAGRKASKTRPWDGSEPLGPEAGGWEVLAPSADPWPYPAGDAPPTREMDREDVADVIAAFRGAAEHAREAGFEVVEVHGAHGYLLHEFLSPVTNHRDDEYGGNFENRTRLAREVTEAVRDVWPDEKPVFVRLSGTDWFDDRESWTVEQSARLADVLADAGADLIDVSSGGITPDSAPPWRGPNFQLALAEHVRANRESDVAVGTVGGVTTAEQADAIVRNERADLVLAARQFLRDPYFGLHAAADLEADLDDVVPVQYRRAF